MNKNDFKKFNTNQEEFNNIGIIGRNEILPFLYDDIHDKFYYSVIQQIENGSILSAKYKQIQIQKIIPSYEGDDCVYCLLWIVLEIINLDDDLTSFNIVRYYKHNHNIKHKTYPKRLLKFINTRRGMIFGGRPPTQILIPRKKPITKPIIPTTEPKKIGRPTVEKTQYQILRTNLLEKIRLIKKKNNLTLLNRQDYINKTNEELEICFNELKTNLKITNL